MMDRKIFIETMLKSKRHLEKLCKYLDSKFMVTAYASQYNTSASVCRSTIENVYNALVYIMNRKINKINLNILIDKSVQYLPKKFRDFVNCFYYHNMTFDECAKKLGCSIRTTLRWNIIIIEKIDEILTRIHYTDADLEKLVAGEDWFWNLYRTCVREREHNHSCKIYSHMLVKQEQRTTNKGILVDFHNF